MEYLIRSMKDGYYISKVKPNNKDTENLILSWEEGKKMETLRNYCSLIKKDEEEIMSHRKRNFKLEDFKQFISYSYIKDRCMLSKIFEEGIISEEEYEELIKINEESEDDQLTLIFDCYKRNNKRIGITRIFRKR